ncbi:MAG: DUF2213 domain-containing protein [Scytonema sp. CRU_2_7]|nr:DUF2213 domain-containing protein [Scytonema sp. CRU_2_7]
MVDLFALTASNRTLIERKKTPQGLYLLQAKSLFVGVMPYIFEVDGEPTLVPVLSAPNELHNYESLQTLIGLAIYKDHQEGDTETDIEQSLGIVLDARVNYDYNDSYDDPIRGESQNVLMTLGFWDESIYDLIAEGYTDLSASADIDLVPSEGYWFGSPYTHEKKNIVYRHMALVKRGTARNGSKSTLILDKKTSKTSTVATLTTLDSKEIKVEKVLTDMDVVAELKKLQAKVDGMVETQKQQTSDSKDSNETKKSPKTLSKAELKQLVRDAVEEVVKENEDSKDKDTTDTPPVTPPVTPLTEPVKKIDPTRPESISVDEQVKETVETIEKAKELGVEVTSFDSKEIRLAALKHFGYPIDDVDDNTAKYVFNNLSKVTTTDDTKGKVKKPLTTPNSTTVVKDSKQVVTPRGQQNKTGLSATDYEEANRKRRLERANQRKQAG